MVKYTPIVILLFSSSLVLLFLLDLPFFLQKDNVTEPSLVLLNQHILLESQIINYTSYPTHTQMSLLVNNKTFNAIAFKHISSLPTNTNVYIIAKVTLDQNYILLHIKDIRHRNQYNIHDILM